MTIAQALSPNGPLCYASLIPSFQQSIPEPVWLLLTEKAPENSLANYMFYVKGYSEAIRESLKAEGNNQQKGMLLIQALTIMGQMELISKLMEISNEEHASDAPIVQPPSTTQDRNFGRN